MKSLLITEIEKKTILHKYMGNTSNSSSLNEELSKIGNLMGVKPKYNLISEEKILVKGVFELPMFKDYGKYLKNIGPEGAQEFFEKDISELSSKLREDGITNDNLAATARKYWSVESLKGSTQLKGSEDIDLIDWFLKTKYPNQVSEINSKILRELETKQNETLKSISRGLDMRLPDNTSPTFRQEFEGEVPIDDVSITKQDVDTYINNLEEGEKFCDAKVKKLSDQRDAARTARDTNLLNDLNNKIRQWEEVKKELSNKKLLYENWKVNYDAIQNKLPKTSIKVAGMEYDMTGLNAFQKFILTNTVTKKFQFIFTILKMAEIAKVGSKVGVLEEAIAGLRNAIGQPPNSMNFKDIDAYTQNVVSTIKAFTGRPKDLGKKLNILDTLKPWGDARTTFLDEWNKFLNMLDASDLTDVEKEQIKKTLLERFSNPKTLEKQGRQWTVFYDDIKTVLQRLDADETGKEVESELQKALKNASEFDQAIIYAKYFKEIILGKTWKELIPSLVQTFIRLGFTGLLTGMRTAVGPLVKFGINPKGLIRTFLRLYLIKSSFSVAAATIIFGGKWAIFGLCEALQLYPDYTKKTLEEYANETWNNYMDDLQDTFKTWPWLDFSFGEQDELVKTTGVFGGDITYRKYRYTEGIFQQKALEWAMEWWSATKNSKSEEDVQNTAVQSVIDWQKETKTNWVDNAIESAGPENIKNYLNASTKLPVYQNTIIELTNDSSIASHLYYEFVASMETPPGFTSQKTPTSKFDDFTPSLNNVIGQVRICERTPIQLKDGTQKCKGKSWRVDAFTPYGTSSTLNKDENFNKYYTMATEGNGSGPEFEKAKKMVEQNIIYFTDEDEGAKAYPSVGDNLYRVEPIGNIKSYLK